MNIREFISLFTFSMACTTIFIFIGYPLLGFYLSGGLGLLASCLYNFILELNKDYLLSSIFFRIFYDIK